MKALLAICAIFLVVLVSGLEAGNAPHQYISEEGIQASGHGIRQRRVTCDIFNSQMLCAFHCLGQMQGYRGGYCERGTCHCRR